MFGAAFRFQPDKLEECNGYTWVAYLKALKYGETVNARYLADNGAAIVLENGELPSMLPLVGQLLHDEARLRSMGDAARGLARPDAASRIARLLLELAEGAKE